MKGVRLGIQPVALVFGLILLAVSLSLIAVGIASLFKRDYVLALIAVGMGSFFTGNLLTTPLELVVGEKQIRLRGLRSRQEPIADIARVERVPSWIRQGWSAGFVRRDGRTAFEIPEHVFNPRALRALMDSLGIPMYGEPYRTPTPREAWTGAHAKERLAWIVFAIALVGGLILVLAKSTLGIALVVASLPLAVLAIWVGSKRRTRN